MKISGENQGGQAHLSASRFAENKALAAEK
jgi:hypothetical protein